MDKRTKIVATIGPASEKYETLCAMIKAGMNVARLNFSHGTYDNHALLIKNIRKAARACKKEVAILQDVQGPRIRVGELPKEGVSFKKGDVMRFVSQSQFKKLQGKNGVLSLPIQYDLSKDLKKGDTILIADGVFEFRVQSVQKGELVVEALTTGTVTSHKGINTPGAKISVNVVTDKDKKDIKFGLSHGIDMIALSFVRCAKDIETVKKEIGKHPVHVIAKIERQEALDNIEEILSVADGIMIARGDLGLEVPIQKIPFYQKGLINLCVAHNKPVIVATQMLESMIVNPRPTRAEVTDVANAIIDHTDAVMLSGETANGKYPVEVITIMNSIIREAESSSADNVYHPWIEEGMNSEDVVADSIFRLVTSSNAKAIIVGTDSGRSARIIAKFRPETNIISLTSNEVTLRQLALTWGITAYFQDRRSMDLLGYEKEIRKLVLSKKIAGKGEKVVIALHHPLREKGFVNTVKIITI